MPRHRRMLAPISSIKHYVHRTNTALASGAVQNHVLVDAVSVAAAGGNAQDVTEGSVVKAVHLGHWVLTDGLTDTNTAFTAIVEKVVANQTAATAAQLANLGSYPNKKNIFYSFQGNLQAAVDGVAPLQFVGGWLLIPKGKQRFGAGDSLVLSMTPAGQQVAICGLTTYKEYQ